MPAADDHTILLVDDEAAILRALQRLFRREKYRILTAESGREALDVLARASEPVSLIISDQRMPAMDGAQFLEASREIAPEAIRFLLTGHSDLDAVIASINRGEIQRYLTKPWNDQDLLLQTRHAVEQVELKRENRRLLELTRTQNTELQQFNRELETKVADRTSEIQAKNTELEESLYNTVRAFSALLKVNTPVLAEHSRRVSRNARRIAAALGLAQAEVDDVEIAGLLHDVAKIGYPRKLLAYQAGFWNSDDAERYDRHPAEGQQAVQFISRMERVGDFIRAHHERFDGQGFPDGSLEGNIPVGGRIIAVANAYDRIAHLEDNTQRRVREYLLAFKGSAGRPAEELRHEAARHYLKQRAFTRFDPDVVKCFLGLGEAGASPVEEVRQIAMTELRPGMRLARDLYATSGSFLLSQGTVISAAHVVKLKLLRAKNLCADSLAVSPPASSGPEGTTP